MSTDRGKELIAIAMYKNSLKHLQQLILDSEECHKNYDKKTIFGKDKFQPSYDKFLKTIAKCARGLIDDGFIDASTVDEDSSIKSINKAMKQLEEVYLNFPYGFLFWDGYYNEFFKNEIASPQKTDEETKVDAGENYVIHTIEENDAILLFTERVINNDSQTHVFNYHLKCLIDKGFSELREIESINDFDLKKSIATDVLGELLNFKKEISGFSFFDRLTLSKKYKILNEINQRFPIKRHENKATKESYFLSEHNSHVRSVLSLFFYAHMIANHDIGNKAINDVTKFINSIFDYNLSYDNFK